MFYYVQCLRYGLWFTSNNQRWLGVSLLAPYPATEPRCVCCVLVRWHCSASGGRRKSAQYVRLYSLTQLGLRYVRLHCVTYAALNLYVYASYNSDDCACTDYSCTVLIRFTQTQNTSIAYLCTQTCLDELSPAALGLEATHV